MNADWTACRAGRSGERRQCQRQAAKSPRRQDVGRFSGGEPPRVPNVHLYWWLGRGDRGRLSSSP